MSLSASSNKIPSSTGQDGSAHSNAASHIATFHIDFASNRRQESYQLISSKHSSSPFPFHHLPSELLAAIFEWGVRSSPPRYRERIPFPIIVSHVCRLWRDTALNTTALWTDIHIDSNTLMDQISCVYLARSKSTLINVSCHSLVYSNKKTFIGAITTSILPHMGRVRQLTLILENERAFLAVMGVFKNVVAPRLESLWISLLGFSLYMLGVVTQANNDSLPLFACGAPLLRSIKFNTVRFIVQPQFTQLTSLSLRMPNYSSEIKFREFYDLLCNISQTLVILKVWEVILEPSMAESDLPPIDLPRLQSLNLFEVDILALVYTPRLQSLYLDSVNPSTMEIFSKRCSSSELPELQSLKLHKLDLSLFESRTAVIHGLPLLTELLFWDCKNERAFLSLLDKDLLTSDQSKEKDETKGNKEGQALTDSAVATPAGSSSLAKGEIMPRLRSLTVSGLDDFSWPWLQEILENRITRGIPIKRVRFPATFGFGGRIENWLTAWNIDCERYNSFETDRLVDPDDHEWMLEEEFYEEGNEGSR